MTNAKPNWEDLNSQHLRAGVEWIMLRLERMAMANCRPQAAPRGIFGWPFKGARHFAATSPTFRQSKPFHEESLKLDKMREIEQQLQSSGQPPPGLADLVLRLGLSSFERDILLLCTAVELNTQVGSLCAQAMDDSRRPYPTFSLALELFEEPEWRGLIPEMPLRRWQLLEVQQPAGTPLVQAALRIEEGVLHFLKGWKRIDERLATMLVPAAVGQSESLCPSQSKVVDRIQHEWTTAVSRQSPLAVIQLLGPDASSKLLVADAIAASFGKQLLRLPLDQLPTSPVDFDLLANLWQRDSRLFGLQLYLDDNDGGLVGEGSAAARLQAVNRLLANLEGFVFLATPDLGPRLSRERIALDVNKPTEAEQRALWRQVLVDHVSAAADTATTLDDQWETVAGELATQFRLNVSSIETIADRLTSPCPLAPENARDLLWHECRELTRPRLDGLAQRIECKAGWDDLELPDYQRDQIVGLAAQVRNRWRVYDQWGFRDKLNRGLGISALFTGESGTGKTMAAEVLASKLKLDLYRVDLSAIVNKYIGETEKNLRRVFDAFEDCGAVLCFDECDALFGKRTEVKDSHDRYANIEVSYLLQRLESYRGLAVLTTNNKGALDPAFLRRLRCVVAFPTPDVAARGSIWQKMFPAPDGRIPTEALDYGWLAKFEFCGGNILSAAMNATFRAAKRGNSRVTMEDLHQSIKSELIKLNRPIRAADLELPITKTVPPVAPISTTSLVSLAKSRGT